MVFQRQLFQIYNLEPQKQQETQEMLIGEHAEVLGLLAKRNVMPKI